MKTLLKRLFRRLARPVGQWVRSLLAAEIDARLRPTLDATAEVVRANVERTDTLVQGLHRSAQENTLLLDSLVRELVRVQTRMEILQQLVEDRHDPLDRANRQDTPVPVDHFAIIDEALSTERLMVG